MPEPVQSNPPPSPPDFEVDRLFQPFQLGAHTLPNRLVAQPMECNDSVEGQPSELTRARYERLAAGGWGAIIVEAVSITTESLARKHQLVVNARTKKALAALVREIKTRAPATLVLVQLTHSGIVSDPAFSRLVSVVPRDNLYYARHYGKRPEDVHVLTTAEIDALLDAFVATARLVSEIGADGIDFKACHGYLGGEFLRPLNARADKYGGTLENRTRFLREGFARIRAEVDAPGFVLGTRVSVYEGIRGGFGTAGPDEVIEDLTEPLALVKQCTGWGIDYLNLSAGVPSITPQLTRADPDFLVPMYQHFRYTKAAKAVAPALPVIGSCYSMCRRDFPAVAEKNLQDGIVDLVGLGRQTLADPAFPVHLRAGRTTAVDWCVGCGHCSTLLKEQREVGCAVYNRHYQKLFVEMTKAKRRRRA